MSLPRVNIFNYTAAANPYFVKSLAHKYGYEFDKDQKLETVLQQLVTYEGEPVMMEIIENNPDKDLFMDYFEKKYGKKEEKTNSNELGGARLLDTYMNFSGQLQAAQQTAENKMLTKETSVMVLLGAVLISFAIMFKNNK
jgi:hypothetical protein